jgi:hypothetical protein
MLWVGAIFGFAAAARIYGNHATRLRAVSKRWRQNAEIIGRPCKPGKAHDGNGGQARRTIFVHMQTQSVR